MSNQNQSKMAKLVPVMLCFFAMGFVDLVGIASNYVKDDLQLTDSVANIFPSLVFFWFLIFSVPTGMLMNKIGRKKTVMLSLIVTVFSLLLPLFGNNFGIMLVAFSLLGIGNALMQTSLNPLVSSIIADLSQSIGIIHYWRQELNIDLDFRSVYQSYRFFHCTLSSYVGSYPYDS